MKITRTLLSIAIVLLITLLFRTCNKESNCKHTELSKEEVIENHKNSRHTIDMKQVADLYGNYKTRFIPEIKKIQDSIDTSSGILPRDNYLPTEYSIMPLQKLKDYLNFIEVLQQKNPDQIISGIAISFGAYNLTDSLNIEKVEVKERLAPLQEDPLKTGDYRGRMTTYITPTYYDSNKKSEYDADMHVPFCISPDNESDNFKGTYIPLYGYLDSTKEYASKIETPKRITARASFLPSFNALTFETTMQSVSINDMTDMPPKKPN